LFAVFLASLIVASSSITIVDDAKVDNPVGLLVDNTTVGSPVVSSVS